MGIRCVVDCQSSGDAGVSRTRQSEAHKCDLNLAVSKYRKNKVLTGPLATSQNGVKAVFGDFVNAPADFLEASNIIVRANNSFLELPSNIRETFKNDPAFFLEFVSNPNNKENCIKMGLFADDVKAEKLAAEKAVEAKVQGEPEPVK